MFAQSDTRSSTIVIDELDASSFQRMANGQIVGCCHGGMTLGEFSPADRSQTYG
jgi:hypothetical protein